MVWWTALAICGAVLVFAAAAFIWGYIGAKFGGNG